MSTITRIPASQFGDPEFAKLNPDYFNEYVAYRVHGYHPHVAFRRVFGEEQLGSNGHLKVDEIEHNPWVRAEVKRRLASAQASELWNERISIHELLNMARNVFAKDNTRLAAIKELNVLYGITVTDEKGNTRRGMSLDEFYKTHGAADPASPNANPELGNASPKAPTTH